MHKLAIVIPAYKDVFLYDTLLSISRQTDKRFTVYIGNDNSPYNIEEVIQKFMDKIEIVYHKFETNLGSTDLVGQWTRCINLVKEEEYIWLFSDDDIMEANCVETFYTTLNYYPTMDIFHFNVKLLDSFQNNRLTNLTPYSSKMSAGLFLQQKLKGSINSFVVEFIFSKKIYDHINGFINFDLAWGSDFLTWLKMASLSCDGIITSPASNSCVHWRKSSENITPDISKPILIRKLQSLIKNAKFISTELKTYQERYYPLEYKYRWIRFPIKEIIKSIKHIGIPTTIKLLWEYFSLVFLR